VANYFDDNDDLQYYFDKGIDWGPLVRATERDLAAGEAGADNVAETVDGYRQMAQMVGTFVAEEVAPAGLVVDREGIHLDKGEAVVPKRMQAIFDQIKALDLHWLCVPRELGGMNSPLLLYFINTELFSRADVSITAHHSFHGGIALALLIFSIREGSTEFDGATITKTRFRDAIEEVARGDAWGTMCITEPDAGSDMAALRTVGEQDEHGNWFVTGQKIFITSGHGKYHFVIARTEPAVGHGGDDPLAGLGGLSFFLVPAWHEDEHGRRHRTVTIDRIEEKLGHHGSCTTALTFDRSPAFLLGQRGEGFKYMLTLMNNARLGVGFESLGVCEAAYRMARDYAAQRPSMGKTIDRHEMIADLLDEMRTDIQAIRALAMYGAYHEELATKYELFASRIGGKGELETKKLERRAKQHKANARRVTPLLKYLAAEKAVEMARRNMQILGSRARKLSIPSSGVGVFGSGTKTNSQGTLASASASTRIRIRRRWSSRPYRRKRQSASKFRALGGNSAPASVLPIAIISSGSSAPFANRRKVSRSATGNSAGSERSALSISGLCERTLNRSTTGSLAS
jgi:alkylation response protein AidB-like acyl-CoA dehydrogenase